MSQIHHQRHNSDSSSTSESVTSSLRTVLPRRFDSSLKVLQHNYNHVRWEHSPMVAAMLTGNTLQSCEAAEAMLADCYEARSEDRICSAAARQFAQCMKLDQSAEQQ